MRFQPIAIAALAVLTAALPAGAEQGSPTLVDRSEKVVDARGLTGLDVDNARGLVALRPSTDGRLHVVATRIFRMNDMASARRYAQETTVQTGPRGTRFAVDVHYPRRIEASFSFFDLFSGPGRHGFHMPSVEVKLEVLVPAGLAVNVTTASGDVEAGTLASPVAVHATSGDVHLAGMRGPVDVNAVSGDVSLEEIARAHVRTTSGDVSVTGSGALDCATVSGDIDVHGARDSLVFSTQSGDVSADAAPAGVRVRTTSGEIDVSEAGGRVSLVSTSGEVRGRLKAPLRSAELSSTSGEVSVELAPGMTAQLRAATVSGSIDCTLPMTIQRKDRTHLEARIGPGGPPVSLNTVSGTLTVTSGGK